MEIIPNLGGLGQDPLLSNEERVWSSGSIISFHANSKVWITEIKAWMY
jgi:hypothetical protein